MKHCCTVFPEPVGLGLINMKIDIQNILLYGLLTLLGCQFLPFRGMDQQIHMILKPEKNEEIV